MAKRFITKKLVESDRTTDILSEQLSAGVLNESIQGEGVVEVIRIDSIRPSLMNPRKLPWTEREFEVYKQSGVPDELSDTWAVLVSLSQSIAENGLMQPIVIKHIEDDDKDFEIIAGERRYWASRLLNRPVVRAIVRKVSEQQHRVLAMTENLAREDLSLIERVDGLRSMIEIDSKYTMLSEVQKLLGISKTQAHRLMKGATNDQLYDLIKAGKITNIAEIDAFTADKKPEVDSKPKIKLHRWVINKSDQEELLELAKQFKPELFDRLSKK